MPYRKGIELGSDNFHGYFVPWIRLELLPVIAYAAGVPSLQARIPARVDRHAATGQRRWIAGWTQISLDGAVGGGRTCLNDAQRSGGAHQD